MKKLTNCKSHNHQKTLPNDYHIVLNECFLLRLCTLLEILQFLLRKIIINANRFA
jgi:hypothetical protein